MINKQERVNLSVFEERFYLSFYLSSCLSFYVQYLSLCLSVLPISIDNDCLSSSQAMISWRILRTSL